MNYETLLVSFMSIGLFIFSGCANNQPQPKVITKKVLYIPSIDEKKAIAILIYKQKELEKRITNLEKKQGIIYRKNSFVNSKFVSNSKNSKNNNICVFSKQNKVVKYCSTKISSKDIYIAKSDVNIRRCAAIHSPIVGKIKKGEKVSFIYCNKYCWCLLKDKRGYVFKKLFIREKIQNIGNKNRKKTFSTKNSILNSDIKNKKNNKKELSPDEVIKNYINSK